jgi:hypothetical protein
LDATCRQVIDGIKAEANGRTLTQLAAERHSILLLQLIAARR